MFILQYFILFSIFCFWMLATFFSIYNCTWNSEISENLQDAVVIGRSKQPYFEILRKNERDQ